jgi:hypothetical protein
MVAATPGRTRQKESSSYSYSSSRNQSLATILYDSTPSCAMVNILFYSCRSPEGANQRLSRVTEMGRRAWRLVVPLTTSISYDRFEGATAPKSSRPWLCGFILVKSFRRID